MPRLRGIEADNLANELPDPDNPNSDKHYASFEFYPFYEGIDFAIYKGLLSSETRRAKTFCVVKALLDQESFNMTAQLLNEVVKRANEAQRLALKFNSILGYEAVSFQIPSMALVHRISDYIGLFRCIVPHEKRLRRQEMVLIEEFLDGDFVQFNTSNGTVPTINTVNISTVDKRKSKKSKKFIETCNSSASNKKKQIKSGKIIPKTPKGNSSSFFSSSTLPKIGPNNLAQAFTHFTWHETKNLILCDLKGVVSHNSYYFSNPTIHSLDSSFGSRDQGASVISEVFSRHRCTNVCRSWDQFTIRGSNTKNQRTINFCQNWDTEIQQCAGSPPLMQTSSSSKTSNKNICTHDNKLNTQ